jgi:hypothetical protein
VQPGDQIEAPSVFETSTNSNAPPWKPNLSKPRNPITEKADRTTHAGFIIKEIAVRRKRTPPTG